MSAPAVWIVAPRRTPIARLGGALAGFRPDDLLALVFRTVVEQAGLDPAALDEVIAGCANQAGEDNRNVARMAALLAGLPYEVPGHTVNRLCASGLTAVHSGARMIRAGDADLVLVGGVESMSRAPYSVPKAEPGRPPSGNLTAWDTSLGWRYPNPQLAARFPLEAMGETAENLVARFDIRREDQDAFACESHRRAVAASDAGRFARELVAVPLPGRKGAETTFSADEGPRRDTNLEALAKLKPAFRAGGTVTAGNASTLNDGAAAMLLASDAALRTHDLTPIARLVAMGEAGVDPTVMGLGPVPASRKALARAGLRVEDLDHVELNEAFAAQALACIRALDLDPDKVNPLGGAIALGHPLGMSGARILTTLCHSLATSGQSKGLAALCVGVGQGVAAIVERA
jgi:acetyl-CoA acyltransferase